MSDVIIPVPPPPPRDRSRVCSVGDNSSKVEAGLRKCCMFGNFTSYDTKRALTSRNETEKLKKDLQKVENCVTERRSWYQGRHPVVSDPENHPTTETDAEIVARRKIDRAETIKRDLRTLSHNFKKGLSPLGSPVSSPPSDPYNIIENIERHLIKSLQNRKAAQARLSENISKTVRERERCLAEKTATAEFRNQAVLSRLRRRDDASREKWYRELDKIRAAEAARERASLIGRYLSKEEIISTRAHSQEEQSLWDSSFKKSMEEERQRHCDNREAERIRNIKSTIPTFSPLASPTTRRRNRIIQLESEVSHKLPSEDDTVQLSDEHTQSQSLDDDIISILTQKEDRRKLSRRSEASKLRKSSIHISNQQVFSLNLL